MTAAGFDAHVHTKRREMANLTYPTNGFFLGGRRDHRK